jgi:simple sugar transport system substrate-binding protein
MMPALLPACAPSEGVTSFLCVNHAIQQPTVGERCRGYADGLGVDLGNSMMDSGTDPAEIKNKVLAYLSANPDVDGILTLGPVSANPTIQALQENGMAGDIHFGTFDLGDEIVEAIKDGTSTGASTSSPSCRPICLSSC